MLDELLQFRDFFFQGRDLALEFCDHLVSLLDLLHGILVLRFPFGNHGFQSGNFLRQFLDLGLSSSQLLGKVTDHLLFLLEFSLQVIDDGLHRSDRFLGLSEFSGQTLYLAFEISDLHDQSLVLAFKFSLLLEKDLSFTIFLLGDGLNFLLHSSFAFLSLLHNSLHFLELTGSSIGLLHNLFLLLSNLSDGLLHDLHLLFVTSELLGKSGFRLLSLVVVASLHGGDLLLHRFSCSHELFLLDNQFLRHLLLFNNFTLENIDLLGDISGFLLSFFNVLLLGGQNLFVLSDDGFLLGFELLNVSFESSDLSLQSLDGSFKILLLSHQNLDGLLQRGNLGFQALDHCLQVTDLTLQSLDDLQFGFEFLFERCDGGFEFLDLGLQFADDLVSSREFLCELLDLTFQVLDHTFQLHDGFLSLGKFASQFFDL